MPETNGENRIRRSVFDNLVDMIILNILFVFSALPLFTYGASYNALYLSIRRLLKSKKYDPVAKYYWSVWKDSFIPTFCSYSFLPFLFWIICLFSPFPGMPDTAIRDCCYFFLSWFRLRSSLPCQCGQHLTTRSANQLFIPYLPLGLPLSR